MIIYRQATTYLVDWKNRKNRKPLIIRGARQVGKTFLVEVFAAEHFKNYIKIDFEIDEEIKNIFRTKDPEKIIRELSLVLNVKVSGGDTLIFLDEIQSCPEAIVSLRYFYERRPDVPVIAAGSLLDFTLKDFQYSMPVGRIEFLYLYPVKFEEYLACVNPQLADFISRFSLTEEISDAVHSKLLDILRDYFFIGGMPEVTSSYLDNHDYLDVQRIQSSIITTMQNDFAKYGSRKQQDYLSKVLKYAASNVGKKVGYSRIDAEIRSTYLKEAFFLLSMSKVVHLVRRTAGSGLPLEATARDTRFKTVFMDIGLVNNICGIMVLKPADLIAGYEGSLAEQYIGQELLVTSLAFRENQLYYWTREEKNSNAELDYLQTFQNSIIPIEVKSGKTGSLKSLHQYLFEKNMNFGLRFNIDKPSLGDYSVKVRSKKNEGTLDFKLLSLPLYLTGQYQRLVAEIERSLLK